MVKNFLNVYAEQSLPNTQLRQLLILYERFLTKAKLSKVADSMQVQQVRLKIAYEGSQKGPFDSYTARTDPIASPHSKHFGCHTPKITSSTSLQGTCPEQQDEYKSKEIGSCMWPSLPCIFFAHVKNKELTAPIKHTLS
jgi:hypothetical protein